MKKILLFTGIILAFTACRKTEFDTVERVYGEADFSHYISVGNSLTQGFADGGLYNESQEYSYPAMIAQQMKIVDPNMDDFLQPTVYGNGSGYIHLGVVNGELTPIRPGDEGGYDADGSWDTWGESEKSRKFNNLGIAGITLMQCVALNEDEAAINNIILGGAELFGTPIFDGNPYSRFMDFGDNPNAILGGGEDIQYIDHIRMSNATFFTCWLGNNDVLGYASSGGVSQSIDGSFLGLGTIEFNTLSDPIDFRAKYDSILTAFQSIGAKGVCATLPDVTSIPLFTTITVQTVKDEFGYSEVYIEDESGTVRPATEADLLLLTVNDSLKVGMGESMEHYITTDYVLDAVEVGNVQSHTIVLNNAIKASAEMHNTPVVDMYTILNGLKAGVAYDGIEISPTYVEGGAFSMDAVHLTPRGYAIVANEFIKTINESYGSNIPLLSIGNYRGVIFP